MDRAVRATVAVSLHRDAPAMRSESTHRGPLPVCAKSRRPRVARETPGVGRGVVVGPASAGFCFRLQAAVSDCIPFGLTGNRLPRGRDFQLQSCQL